jgi:hypothetical protein
MLAARRHAAMTMRDAFDVERAGFDVCALLIRDAAPTSRCCRR